MSDYIISSISQKGGVGKSSLAQLVAHGYASREYSVLLADMDISQQSSVKWNLERRTREHKPEIGVKSFATVKQALKEGEGYDLMVFDGAPSATAQTLEIAKLSTLILLPSNTSKYDLDPQINLAHELVRAGIDKSRIYLVLSRIVATENDLKATYEYIQATPYKTFQSYLEEKTGYRQTAEQGRALTETTFKSLAARSQDLFSSISTALLKTLKSAKTVAV